MSFVLGGKNAARQNADLGPDHSRADPRVNGREATTRSQPLQLGFSLVKWKTFSG